MITRAAHARHELKWCLYTICHSRPQRPRSFWSAPRIATSGLVQHRKSEIHGLPVTLRMFRVKSDKSDWFWSQSIVFSKPFKNGMSLDRTRGRDSWCWPKGAWTLGTRMLICLFDANILMKLCGSLKWLWSDLICSYQWCAKKFSNNGCNRKYCKNTKWLGDRVLRKPK